MRNVAIPQFDTPLINYYAIAKQAAGIQWEQNALNVNLIILIRNDFAVSVQVHFPPQKKSLSAYYFSMERS